MDLLSHRIGFGRTRLAAICLAAAWSVATAAPAQVAPLSARSVAVDLSSGRIDNPGDAAVAFSVDVDMGPEALWVRVLFAEAGLPGDSAVRVTSLLDGETQTLSSQQLSEWRFGTGFFNGSAVRIELLAGAGTTGNLIRVDRFVIGLPPIREFLPRKAVCGSADQRTPASDPAVGRLPGSGCSGFLIDCPDGGTCLLSAGHCFAGELSTVIQFDVPVSEADCAPRHPPMDEQFAVDPDSVVVVDGGPGNDWALFRTFTNPETGLTSFAEQGASYTVAEATPASGTVRVTGFGVDAHGDATGGGIAACDVCDPETGNGGRNLTQQTHFGDVVERVGTALTYRADTCAGNSGSPVVSAATGEVVAVHTHTGCAASANLGTAVTRERLLEVLANRGELALDKDGALDLGDDGVANPGDTVDYTFRVTNTGQVTVTGVTISDPLVSPITCPGGHPIPFFEAGASVTCTGSASVTQEDVDAGVKHNTAAVTGADPLSTLVRAEDSHSEPIPPPTTGPQPFACTGEAYIVQNENAQLTVVDQTVDPFEFVSIGAPAGTEINNLGFRSSDGFLYGVELSGGGNGGIVRIDRDGNVFNLGHPPALPTAPRFDAGDVTPDGTAMYITATSRPLYRLDLTQLPAFPPVTHVAIRGAGGSVSDWTVSPVDGKLYGGDSAQGQLAVVEPSTGDRVDFDVPGLPSGSPFGGAWFDASGRLFLYRNSGAIYEIDLAGSDLSGPTIVDVQNGPGSSRNDAAACSATVATGPAIDLAKNGELDLGGDGVANPGDLIHYTFRVANVGIETLTGVTVDDPLVASISCPGGHPIPSMAPGASQTCTGSAALTQDDVDAGAKDNTATVTALAEGGQTVTDQDSHSESIPAPAADRCRSPAPVRPTSSRTRTPNSPWSTRR